MKWNEGISGAHLDIASSESKRIAILAGPGTGKTTFGLLRRIARLLQEGKEKPENILFLTFARTTAEDFVRKLDEYEVEGHEGIESGTLHSFCLRLLKQDGVFKSTGRHAERVLMAFEEDAMLYDLEGDFGNLHSKEKFLEHFVNGWAENPQDYPALPKDAQQRRFQQHIRNWLEYHEAMLIGEVVPLTYNYLASNPSVEVLQNYSHVLVDEYQDLNKTEQGIIEMLAGKDGSLCVAGDDDQSIYGFRCANPKGMQEYFSHAEEQIMIETCGRCPKSVLDVANKIKEYLPENQKGPMLCNDPSTSGSVNLIQWDDAESEAIGIAKAVDLAVKSGKYEPGDFLILIQSKDLGKTIRNKIREMGIKCESFFQEDPIGGPESKRAFCILQLLVNPRDLVSFRYWLGIGDGKFRHDSYKKLLELSRSLNLTPREVLEKISRNELPKTGFLALINRLSELELIMRNIEGKEVSEVIDFIFPEGNEDIDDLRQIALQVKQTSGSVSDLLANMTKLITQPGVPENPDFVRVMSLHKSKGLTSVVVFIAGMVEGIMPRGSVVRDADALAEARRLFYVAVTRAKSSLVISSFFSIPEAIGYKLQIPKARYMVRNGERYLVAITSRFIEELRDVLPSSTAGTQWLARKRP